MRFTILFSLLVIWFQFIGCSNEKTNKDTTPKQKIPKQSRKELVAKQKHDSQKLQSILDVLLKSKEDINFKKILKKYGVKVPPGCDVKGSLDLKVITKSKNLLGAMLNITNLNQKSSSEGESNSEGQTYHFCSLYYSRPKNELKMKFIKVFLEPVTIQKVKVMSFGSGLDFVLVKYEEDQETDKKELSEAGPGEDGVGETSFKHFLHEDVFYLGSTLNWIHSFSNESVEEGSRRMMSTHQKKTKVLWYNYEKTVLFVKVIKEMSEMKDMTSGKNFYSCERKVEIYLFDKKHKGFEEIKSTKKIKAIKKKLVKKLKLPKEVISKKPGACQI